ncbi:MAG: 4-(cytidine 5'-diphospho)-2-C-methyl-D-erythritol kinase [Planctomycetota bacterium]
MREPTDTEPAALCLTAPAKVNLSLRIRGRRRDGYHEIESCMQTLELADELCCERRPAPGFALELTHEVEVGLPVLPDADNLVLRAAAAFALAAGDDKCGAQFRLTKRIPAGGGLGGGSSDAAAALLLLNALFGTPLSAHQLHELAACLGADVPFFLSGGTQVARGIGDLLEPVPDAATPRFHFVLIAPPFGTSTAAIYKNCKAPLTEPAGTSTIPGGNVLSDKGLPVPDRPDAFINELEASAMRAHPELEKLAADIALRGFRDVRMSGSGSTLFLAFEERAAATAAMQRLASLREAGVHLEQTETERDPRRSRRPAAPADDRPGLHPHMGDNRGGAR